MREIMSPESLLSVLEMNDTLGEIPVICDDGKYRSLPMHVAREAALAMSGYSEHTPEWADYLAVIELAGETPDRLAVDGEGEPEPDIDHDSPCGWRNGAGYCGCDGSHSV